MKEQYENIIDYPYTGTKRKNKMSLLNRAAQFAPFSALSGYEDAIIEASRSTSDKKELEEQEIEKLNYVLQIISNEIQQCPLIQITYFVADKLKQGGEYKTVVKRIKRIDEIKQELILMDGAKIGISYISDIVIVE